MRKQMQIILDIITLLFIAGCASSGNPQLTDLTSATVAAHIIRGQTTMAQVRSLYGDPLSRSFTSGGQRVWTCEFRKMHAAEQNFIPTCIDFEQNAVGRKTIVGNMFRQSRHRKGLFLQFL